MHQSLNKQVNNNDEFKYKDFDDIPISTTTVIVSTNLEINLEWLYSVLPVVDVDVSNVSIKVNKDFQRYVLGLDLPYGSLTMVQHKSKLKGFKLKKKNKKYLEILCVLLCM